MQTYEWAQIIELVESLWGKSAKWRRADAAMPYARTVSHAAAETAVQRLFMDGSANAPSPSEVLAQARSTTTNVTTHQDLEAHCEHHGHSFAIVEEQTGLRRGICRVCRLEELRPAHLMPTVSEIEDGDFEKMYRADEAEERIAP